MFYFRIDLGSKSGLGHFNRVKSLIKYLQIKDYKIVVDHLTDINPIKNKKNIIYLYNKTNSFKERIDAEVFINLIKKEKNKPIVVKDSYRMNYFWEKKVSKFSKKLLVISDYLNQKHHADFYLNHSPRFVKITKEDLNILYKNNKKKCNFLLGPDYALFNFDYKTNKRLKMFKIIVKNTQKKLLFNVKNVEKQK